MAGRARPTPIRPNRFPRMSWLPRRPNPAGISLPPHTDETRNNRGQTTILIKKLANNSMQWTRDKAARPLMVIVRAVGAISVA